MFRYKMHRIYIALIIKSFLHFVEYVSTLFNPFCNCRYKQTK